MSDHMSPIRPYSPTERIDEVEIRIREFLVNSGLAPGDAIPGEHWFSEQLGVGRPLIREAFKKLEGMGLVEVRRGKGRILKSFDLDGYLNSYSTDMLMSQFSYQELFETRCILEVSMIGDSVQRLTDAEMAEIEVIWNRMCSAYDADLIPLEEDIQLHRAIMTAANNRLILAVLDAVLALARKSLAKGGVSDTDRRDEDRREHEELVEAVRNRDSNRARQALALHYSTAASRLGFKAHWQTFNVPLMSLTLSS